MIQCWECWLYVKVQLYISTMSMFNIVIMLIVNIDKKSGLYSHICRSQIGFIKNIKSVLIPIKQPTDKMLRY